MKHIHHIIPKHMGGTDCPDNLIELTIEQHAEAHRQLYKRYGKWQDKVAWKGLSKQYETNNLGHVASNEWKEHNPEKHSKISSAGGKSTWQKHPELSERQRQKNVEKVSFKILTDCGEFPSVRAAARHFGVAPSTGSRWLLHGTNGFLKLKD